MYYATIRLWKSWLKKMKGIGRSKVPCQQNSTFYVRYSASAYEQVGQVMHDSSLGTQTVCSSSNPMTRSAECLLDNTDDDFMMSTSNKSMKKGKEKSAVFYVADSAAVLDDRFEFGSLHFIFNF